MKPEPISNRKLTLLRKLGQKKYRWRKQLFLVEGARAVEQIIQNKQLQVKALFFDEQQHLWKQELWESLAKATDSFVIPKKDFADVSDTTNPQGVMVLCHIPKEFELKELAAQTGVIVASDAVQDPGNMGTIIRTASWFGAKGFLSGKGTVDLFHPKVVRATAGATGTVPYAKVELPDSLNYFEDRGWQIVLLDAGDHSMPLKKLNEKDKIVIVVGNEAHGVDESLFSLAREKVCISSTDETGVESLNAAVSVSVALYEMHSID